MKRCPQCEFVYEDEQTLCDMDGNKLVFDSRPLPKLQALTNAPQISAAKSFWRPRLIPAAASLVLATVLGLVYYVSTHRQPRMAVPAARPQQSVQQSVATPEGEPRKVDTPATPSEPTATAPETEKVTTEAEAKQAAAAKPETADSTTQKKKRPTNLNTPQTQPVKPAAASEEKPKKDSKVSAILKKTGRLLKKPFKF